MRHHGHTQAGADPLRHSSHGWEGIPAASTHTSPSQVGQRDSPKGAVWATEVRHWARQATGGGGHGCFCPLPAQVLRALPPWPCRSSRELAVHLARARTGELRPQALSTQVLGNDELWDSNFSSSSKCLTAPESRVLALQPNWCSHF